MFSRSHILLYYFVIDWYLTCDFAMDLKIIKLSELAVIPSRATFGSVGYDLYTPVPFKIPAGKTVKIPLDISIRLPSSLWAKIESRSSLAKKGVVATGGVIDTDYHGNIAVLLNNYSADQHCFNRGDRIAQMVLHYAIKCQVVDQDDKDVDDVMYERGRGGFGSTGL